MAPEDTTANAAVAGEGVADPVEAKGKGKAASDEPAIEDDAMDEDDSSSDEGEGEGEGEQVRQASRGGSASHGVAYVSRTLIARARVFPLSSCTL